MQSDSELVDRTLVGEHAAYAVLVERYERLARAAAVRIVHDLHLADDVVQESFVAAFATLASLRDSSKFGPWLLGIARRQAARVVRQRSRLPVLVSDSASPAEPHSNVRGMLESVELLELVERLPEHEGVVIGLRHFAGHSVQEIARITDRPVGTITKQLSRAHERLHTWLNEERSHERHRETRRTS